MWATESGYEALLDTGKVGADSKDKGSQTLLSRAARGYEAVVKLLLDVSEVDEGSRWSVTAIGGCYKVVLQLLIERARGCKVVLRLLIES